LDHTKGLGSALLSSMYWPQGLFKLARGAMRTAAHAALRQRGEPALNLVQPGGRGRREVHMEVCMGLSETVRAKPRVGRAAIPATAG
jgi:hypothetical protein